jgi:microcystin-dependent protein
MPAKFTNNATATLAASLSTSSTSITVTTGQGALFPTLGASEYFYATLTNSSNNIEIVKITARASDTLTAVRAQEGTTALTWNAADKLELRITSAVLTNFAQQDSPNTFAGAMTYGGVTLSNAVTGTGNMVLSASPTISSPTITGGTFSSPTLTTPALGTPSAAVLTNGTGLPLTTGVTGVLPVANGGTGLTSLTTIQTPIGSFLWHTMPTPPLNYLEANGAALSRTTYAALFAVIGTTYGSGDGSTTFNVPDVRGYFVRGYDNGRGVDSGRAFGSNQANSIQSHTHGMWQAMSRDSAQGDPNASSAGTFNGGAGQFFSHPNTDSTGSTETRPVNIAFLPCIRYQ